MRTLALGAPDSVFFRSISHLLPHFGTVDFAHERDFASPAEMLARVRERHDRVLMPNPYGNPLRLQMYRALRRKEFPVIAVDRGALPGSWFFDQGFNADSPSYRPEVWNRALTTTERADTEEYIRRLRSSSNALERQGPRTNALELRKRLHVAGDERILFVPLQRPSDTVVEHFAGPVGGLEGFLDLVHDVAAHLEHRDPGRWRVILKKHPLEQERPPIRGPLRYAPDGTHVHDLLDAADAVLVLNSGVGLLSLCFGKPTLHVGEAFYGQPGLARSVRSAEEAAMLVLAGEPPSTDHVLRFVHHLRHRLYSFGRSETELRIDGEGARRRITRHIELAELRILGETVDVSGDRIVVVSPVVPTDVARGSETRVCEMLQALDHAGLRVSLAVLNSRNPLPSAEIERGLRQQHPFLEHVSVHRHPRIDRSLRGRIQWQALRFAAQLTLASQRVANLETCPPAFRRDVANMVARAKPRFLLVNYAKMAPSVPRSFEGIAIVDTHDLQTNLLIDEQAQSRSRRRTSRRLFRLSERLALSGFDQLIAINPGEQRELQRLFPHKPVHFIPAFVRTAPAAGAATVENTSDALFVASKSTFNVRGLRWFRERVLPRILAERPAFRLRVVGNIAEVAGIDCSSCPAISFEGVVPDLGPAYAGATCVIAPVLGGAGMKIKVIDALAHGKAVVATPRALDGIGAVDGQHVRVASTPAEFAEAVLELIANDGLRRSLERGARALHARDHSPEAVAKALEELFRTSPEVDST